MSEAARQDKEYDIETAKRILHENGYVVSPKPVEWQEHKVLITIKIQSRMYTTKDLVRYLSSELDRADISFPQQLAAHAGRLIMNASVPKVEEYHPPREPDDDK